MIAYWNLAEEAPPVTALRWDWNVATLTNDTGTGSETWVDQDVTDGQANDIVLNWDYPLNAPAPAVALVLGDWLVGHPRAYNSNALSPVDFLYGGVVTPVGVKDFEATMTCRITGTADAGETAGFSIFRVNCFGGADLLLILTVDDAGNCLARVELNTFPITYGPTVSIPTSTIVDIGVRVTADGLLNTNIELLVDGIVEDTMNLLDSSFSGRVQIQGNGAGRAFIGINDYTTADFGSPYQFDIALYVFRYQLATL
jgi:hypothetical protein